MQLGIFARTFQRPTLAANLDAVVAHNLHCVQFNLTCAGLPSLPDSIEPEVVGVIRTQMQTRGISMAAISGTFNMAHPDPRVRQTGLDRLRVLANVCQELGTHLITLCTGTRDPHDMWHWHDHNTFQETWQDMLATMSTAVEIAEAAGVWLAFEPERANVIYKARRAYELITTLRSPVLKVVLDPANIIDGTDQAAIRPVLDEAFALLADHIVLAHAKDKAPDDSYRAAGKGVLDYPYYLSLLEDIHFKGALIIHGLEEAEVEGTVRFLKEISRLLN